MFEPTITNLRVLSKVEFNDKISVQESKLYVSKPYWTRPMRRYMTGNSRDKSIDVIRTTINNAVELSNSLMISDLDPDQDKQVMRNYSILKNLHEAMSTSVPGIDLLKKSYIDDSACVAALEGISITLKDQNDIVARFIAQN